MSRLHANERTLDIQPDQMTREITLDACSVDHKIISDSLAGASVPAAGSARIAELVEGTGKLGQTFESDCIAQELCVMYKGDLAWHVHGE